MGNEALWPAGTLAFGLWHRFVSAPSVFRFGALHVVACQLPDVPPPWELERDARGLTFDVLTGCVG